MCRFCDKNSANSLKNGLGKKFKFDVYLSNIYDIKDFELKRGYLTIETEKKAKRMFLINYCPVCGEKLREELLSEEEIFKI